jgi:hypothetical protein
LMTLIIQGAVMLPTSLLIYPWASRRFGLFKVCVTFIVCARASVCTCMCVFMCVCVCLYGCVCPCLCAYFANQTINIMILALM